MCKRCDIPFWFFMTSKRHPKKRQPRQPSVSFTPHKKVLRHIDTLLLSGLYGRSRSELVRRLVSEGIVARIGHPRFKVEKKR
jgi:hypothetical protein